MGHRLTFSSSFLTYRERAIILRDQGLARRLTWRHGAERARSIIDGEDERAEADVAAWNALPARLVR
jgi:hypothetical protein